MRVVWCLLLVGLAYGCNVRCMDALERIETAISAQTKVLAAGLDLARKWDSRVEDVKDLIPTELGGTNTFTMPFAKFVWGSFVESLAPLKPTDADIEQMLRAMQNATAPMK